MGILHLKWITEDDPELQDLRARFAQEFPQVKVGPVRPERGTHWSYTSYYIQIIPEGFPPCVHFEYWADRSQGFLDLHLEPNRGDKAQMKAYQGIGINLMHLLTETGIEYGYRWELPFGYFRIWGIRNVDDLIGAFGRFYGLVDGKIQQIYQHKKSSHSLKVDYPKQEVPYVPLRSLVNAQGVGVDEVNGEPVYDENGGEGRDSNNGEEVTTCIMSLDQVMSLPLTLPDYQREYCWEDRNITDLWHNLTKIKEGRPFHLGTIILHDNNRHYDIIDGQQRLITLSLILLALGYDKYLPLLNASYQSQDALEHVANCKYVVQSLLSKERNHDSILKRIKDEVSFAVLVVNEANLDLAYTFFTNQNSKGVPLSDFDLLKAHHLRFVPDDQQAEHMAVKWNKMSQMPPVYKEKNSLSRVLGTHLYRLRRWMRKNDSLENSSHYIQKEYQAALTMAQIPPFGEKFDFYEKIQGGTHFFVYAETFIHRYNDFLTLVPQVIADRNQTIVKTLHTALAWGPYEIFADTIETLLFAYYLKFGNQYLAEALYCIAQLMALYRYNSGRVAGDGTGVRHFANENEIVLMIDQASSPTFFLAEALEKLASLSQRADYPISSGIDLPESRGVKWGIYLALRDIFHKLLPEISESTIRNRILEEYGA